MAALLVVSLALGLAPSCSGDRSGAAPALQARTLAGDRWDLGAHRGRWVIVAFQASTCAPCKKELPIFSKLASSHRDLDIVSVGLGETAGVFGTFLRPFHISWPAIADRQARISERWEVVALPTTVVVDPDGDVAARFGRLVSPERLAAAIR